jgi:hypothetical protein
VQTLTKVEDSWLTPEGAQFCNKQIQAKTVNKLGHNALFPNTRSLTFNTEPVFIRITAAIVWPPYIVESRTVVKGWNALCACSSAEPLAADFGRNTALLWVAMPIASQKFLRSAGVFAGVARR